METKRHIGIDLHRNCFTVCVRLENGRNYLSDWKLEDLPRFTKKLRAGDEIAVEMTGNTRFFHEGRGATCSACSDGGSEPVQGDQPIGEEDGSE
jgi:hypothetical protein